MPKTGWSPTFRMKQLPKAEYQLLKEMMAQYRLDDPSELVTALLRLAAEVQVYNDTEGQHWLQRIVTATVNDLRS